MSLQLNRKIIYSPAELGFDSRAVAFGATADGNWVEWRKAFNFYTFTLIFEDVDGAGATPFSIAISVRGLNFLPWVNSDTVESLVTGVTNNPRTQYLHFTPDGVGNAVSAGTTGTFIAGAHAKLFSAPFIRFSIANTHVSINALVRMRAVLHL